MLNSGEIMKKRLLLIVLFVLSVTLYAQERNDLVSQFVADVSQDSLLKFVSELSGEVPVVVYGTEYTITSRHKNSQGNIIAADYIKEKLEYYGLTAETQEFSSTGKNVYGIKTGTEFPDEIYMICAHYDDMPSSGAAPGADDNASGTAAVLEAARVLQNTETPYTMIFALWDEEEQGLVGSDYYAETAADNNMDIKGVINLDMIAWEDNGDNLVKIHARDVGASLDIADKMVECISKYDINLTYGINNPGITASDHASFWSQGYGAVLLIEDDDDDFNNYYHTSNDLMVHFDNEFFTNCTKLALATFSTFALNLDIIIEHTPVVAIDNSNDIEVSAGIVSFLEIASGDYAPRLYYQVDDGNGFGNFDFVTGEAAGNGNYNFVIPGQPLGVVVQYYIAAQDAEGNMVTTLPSGGNGVNPPGTEAPDELFRFFVTEYDYAFNDYCSDMSLWQPEGGWGLSTAHYVSGPSSFADSPDGDYPVNAESELIYNETISLVDIMGAELVFNLKYDIEEGWDYAQVLISTDNGTNWMPLEGLHTTPGSGSFQPTGEPLYDGASDWVNERVDLTGYAGHEIKLKFLLISDSYINEDGIYIDDIALVRYKIVPVELLSFTAEGNGKSVVLNWKTATELNNKGFAVEKSADGQTFSEIAFIEGHGTSSELNVYTFTDNMVTGGNVFYRLKQTDYNGEYKYYGPIEVNNEIPLAFRLEQNYPNPFNPSTKIAFALPENGRVKLAVYDVLGREVALPVNEFMESGYHEITFTAGDITSGFYIYKLTAGKFSETKKMMFVK